MKKSDKNNLHIDKIIKRIKNNVKETLIEEGCKSNQISKYFKKIDLAGEIVRDFHNNLNHFNCLKKKKINKNDSSYIHFDLITMCNVCNSLFHEENLEFKLFVDSLI